MRFASLLAFTLSTVVYATAFAIPPSDFSTDLSHEHASSGLHSRHYSPHDEARISIDERIRRSYPLELRDDSEESGAMSNNEEELLSPLQLNIKNWKPGEGLGLNEEDGRRRGKDRPSFTVTKPAGSSSRPQRQDSQAYSYQQSARPNAAPQAPASPNAAQSQRHSSSHSRRPSVSYGASASHNPPQAGAAPAHYAGYPVGSGRSAQGAESHSSGASYGHAQPVTAPYGYAQPAKPQGRPSTSHGAGHSTLPVIPPQVVYGQPPTVIVLPPGYAAGPSYQPKSAPHAPVIPYIPPPPQQQYAQAPVIPSLGQSEGKSKGGVLDMFKKKPKA
ncbi:hypothetical protein K474DRAFT_1678290 [Panus rudis PR-1116 ss-1]|nr:hypothetical protein K474DRAFT_1678290 [Panus rudis PR-1116 ss-1]